MTSRFGIMFFDDAPAAFANLASWLAPGGRFAFAVWARPADNVWMSILRDVVERAVGLPPPQPDAPGPFRYADVAKLAGLLHSVGFADVESTPWRGKIALGGGLAPDAAADFALASFSIAEPILRASSEVQAQVRASLTDRFASHVEDGVVRLEAAVHLVTGMR